MFLIMDYSHNISSPLGRTTLVVDGNWLLMGRQFMLREKFARSRPEASRRAASEELAGLMAQSISVCLRTFGNIITNVIFVSDGGSWRKKVDKPGVIADAVYKGTRSLESETDWGAVFESMNILRDGLKVMGMTVSNAPGVEGDDWCWWWSRKLNAAGENVILWTIDEDVKQLIRKDPETGCWTAWYEKRPGLVLPESMSPSDPDTGDDLDFFMSMPDTMASPAKALERYVKVSYCNPAGIVNKKIFVGDGGDNILPVFTYEKNGKVFKATVKDLEKVIDMDSCGYGTDGWIGGLDDVYRSICESKKKILRSASSPTTIQDFIEHAMYNRKMVWLDGSQIPEDIQDVMSEVEYRRLRDDVMHDLRFNWRSMTSGQSPKDELASLLGPDEDLPF